MGDNEIIWSGTLCVEVENSWVILSDPVIDATVLSQKIFEESEKSLNYLKEQLEYNSREALERALRS